MAENNGLPQGSAPSAVPSTPSTPIVSTGTENAQFNVRPWNSPKPTESSRADQIGHGLDGINQNQHRDLLKHAVDTGRLSLDDANKMLASESISPIAIKDELTDESLYDRNYSAPASPDGYSNIPSLNPFGQEPTEESEAADQGFRKAVHAAGFSNEMAKSLADILRDSNALLAQMKSTETYDDWTNKQAKGLEVIWGDKKDERVRAVQKYIAEQIEPRAPGTWKLLSNFPAAGSAYFVKCIYDHMVRSAIRRDGGWSNGDREW